jgi:hypothetical protein
VRVAAITEMVIEEMLCEGAVGEAGGGGPW